MKKCTPWKISEWKLNTPESDRKITPQKMTEKSNLENARMEISHPGKYQNGKCTTLKIPEQKWHALKMTEKSQPRKCQKMHSMNLPAWKMHTLENSRMEIAHSGK